MSTYATPAKSIYASVEPRGPCRVYINTHTKRRF